MDWFVISLLVFLSFLIGLMFGIMGTAVGFYKYYFTPNYELSVERIEDED